MKNKKAFTLVELVVVITIMVTLSAIWFIQYSSSLVDSRNAARFSDMWNLKMSLKNYKLKFWNYPNPWSYFFILNTAWSWIIKQWVFDDTVYVTDMTTVPRDPQNKKNYFYSVTNNNLYMQIAMSLEDSDQTNDNWYKALVDWDYQQVIDSLPWIVFAQSAWSSVDLSKLIVNNWTFNLPYWEDWTLIQTATSSGDVLSQSWITIPKFFGFRSCDEVGSAWYNLWSWTYKLMDSYWSVTSSWCFN